MGLSRIHKELWRTSGGLQRRFLGFDVARNEDEGEEGTKKERGDLDHGEKGGASGAGVVDEDSLGDAYKMPARLVSTACTRQEPNLGFDDVLESFPVLAIALACRCSSS